MSVAKPAVLMDARLSYRQQAIVDLLVAGDTAKEIAAKLAVSVDVVEHQIGAARRKTGARNVHHLTALCGKSHLVNG